MPDDARRRRSSPLELLIHTVLAPASCGTFSWQLNADQRARLADDLRWIVLRRVFPELNGRTPYRALIQKHAVKVDSLSREFFLEILEVVRDRHTKDFSLAAARKMRDLELLETYFIPVILQWADNERSTSVARERTPSLEDLITHEDSSGNIYQRFPDDFAWAVNRLSPDHEPEIAREIPAEMNEFVHAVARELARALMRVHDTGRFDRYVLLIARLEDDVCTWEMTFDYLRSLGVKQYSSWKSMSVVANRTLREFIDTLPEETREALHQNDPALTQEEKHDRLRLAVAATVELYPVPTPKQVLASVSA